MAASNLGIELQHLFHQYLASALAYNACDYPEIDHSFPSDEDLKPGLERMVENKNKTMSKVHGDGNAADALEPAESQDGPIKRISSPSQLSALFATGGKCVVYLTASW